MLDDPAIGDPEQIVEGGRLAPERPLACGQHEVPFAKHLVDLVVDDGGSVDGQVLQRDGQRGTVRTLADPFGSARTSLVRPLIPSSTARLCWT